MKSCRPAEIFDRERRPGKAASRQAKNGTVALAVADLVETTEPSSAGLIRSKGVRPPGETSAAILAAAVHEFAQKGYGGARVDAIAARSGANKRMIYHYFGSKEALYLTVLEAVFADIRSAESKLHLANRDPVEAMVELTRFTWRYFLDHPEFLSLLGTDDPRKARYLERSRKSRGPHSPLVAVLSDTLCRGVALGRFRADVDPARLWITIASLAAFYLANRASLSVILRRELDGNGELDTWERHMVSVVLSYLRP